MSPIFIIALIIAAGFALVGLSLRLGSQADGRQ